MTFNNTDNENLIGQLVCTKCYTSIPSTTQKIVKFIACNSIQLVSSWKTVLPLKLAHSKKSYWCNAEILTPILPKDLKIRPNEKFITYMLPNVFEVKYLKQCHKHKLTIDNMKKLNNDIKTKLLKSKNLNSRYLLPRGWKIDFVLRKVQKKQMRDAIYFG